MAEVLGEAIVAGRVAAGEPLPFRTGILPVMTKAGCNAGACHGAATGQDLVALGSQRAAHMVNQLLSMARAEAKEATLQRQSIDLAEVTRDYQVNNTLYQDLLRKREQALVSMNINKERQGLGCKTCNSYCRCSHADSALPEGDVAYIKYHSENVCYGRQSEENRTGHVIFLLCGLR